jgi:hypothetical protein
VAGFSVSASDPQGREVFSQSVTLSAFGTFSGELRLSEAAAVGDYSMSIRRDRRYYASAGFQVAEYRRPEFQVAVSADKAEYVSGDTISVSTSASYFFGGAVSDSTVTWRLMSEDLVFRPDTLKGYWDLADWAIPLRAARKARLSARARARPTPRADSLSPCPPT